MLCVLSAACAFEEETIDEGEANVPLEPELYYCPYPTGCTDVSVIDCSKPGNSTCYECGNSNGVLCCFLGSCRVINKPVYAPIGK